MLAFILGVGCFFLQGSIDKDDLLGIVGGLLATVFSTITFVRCAISNPGVIRPKHSIPDVIEVLEGGADGLPRRGDRHCSKCNIDMPRGCSHCDFCQVCIEGHDHHCPWMGKCIGRGNLTKFYTFIATSLLSLAFIFGMTVFQADPTAR